MFTGVPDATGVVGVAGVVGVVGAVGVVGVPDTTGVVGVAGVLGADGADGTVPGFTAPWVSVASPPDELPPQAASRNNTQAEPNGKRTLLFCIVLFVSSSYGYYDLPQIENISCLYPEFVPKRAE